MAFRAQRSMLPRMQRVDGGRFTLLRSSTAGEVWFDAELSTSEVESRGRLWVSAASGEVQWHAAESSPAPPSWLLAYARAALRVAWRERDVHGWPRRITRWRAKPRPRTLADATE